jgi:hypothetical protein
MAKARNAVLVDAAGAGLRNISHGADRVFALLTSAANEQSRIHGSYSNLVRCIESSDTLVSGGLHTLKPAARAVRESVYLLDLATAAVVLERGVQVRRAAKPGADRVASAASPDDADFGPAEGHVGAAAAAAAAPARRGGASLGRGLASQLHPGIISATRRMVHEHPTSTFSRGLGFVGRDEDDAPPPADKEFTQGRFLGAAEAVSGVAARLLLLRVRCARTALHFAGAPSGHPCAVA